MSNEQNAPIEHPSKSKIPVIFALRMLFLLANIQTLEVRKMNEISKQKLIENLSNPTKYETFDPNFMFETSANWTFSPEKSNLM
jgi:hypothetical protein